MKTTHPGFPYATEAEGRAEALRYSRYQTMAVILIALICWLS